MRAGVAVLSRIGVGSFALASLPVGGHRLPLALVHDALPRSDAPAVLPLARLHPVHPQPGAAAQRDAV
jgi:hypothetical protein